MKLYFLALCFSLLVTGASQAISLVQPSIESSPLQMTSQSCITGWVHTTTQATGTPFCLEVSNCTKNGTFNIASNVCSSLIDTHSSYATGEQKIALKLQEGGKEYIVTPEMLEANHDNSNSKLDTAFQTGMCLLNDTYSEASDNDIVAPSYHPDDPTYHLFLSVLHGYEIIKKAYSINQDGPTPKHVVFMAYYLAGGAIHLLKTPLLQIISDLSYMAPTFFYTGMVMLSGIAYQMDCNCGGCCCSPTTFQRIYRLANPHTVMMLVNLLALMGFTR